MNTTLTNEYGNIVIEENAISFIAANAAMTCYGLVGMSSKSATDGFFELLKLENQTKGVKVKIEEDKLFIDLYVVIQFGTKISVVANNIIDTVKYNVENFTGIEVEKVAVHVQDVRVQKDA
ncbi:MAG: Asp23/Gls24 family envelope stress response protein [Tissierellales bacterium]|jgi:uncharacterized alkaline shock family protein YloU|nr:Asp23/Gls24 family envelope stress response protein [Tissierellales bacterium]